MPAPQEILELAARFERNRADYKSGRYNETQVRREFVDPFFKSLGWDVDNEQGYAEAYKDVIHEAEVQVEGKAKAPDYSFRIGGTRKFFVEAKKPSIFVKEDIVPAFQLRRYGWSARLPLSIVTDFEEFAVYDCRVKPVRTDKASTARIMYLTFDQYREKWDEIAGIFSREEVLRGLFDRFAESAKGKRGTAEVDAEFLSEIEKWRDKLARDIALRNRELAQGEINYAVQMTIDRLIFLRICEDRGIEPYQQLHGLMKSRGIYERLCGLFRQADDRYNSGLFHFREEKGRGYPDTWTLALGIDDDTLVQIIRGLYYPTSPYEFSVMPASVLGQVYEQFLGKVIRLTAGHRATVEDKPEVKKAGGVYYTPDYIVDYIVRNTVGKLLEGRTPAQATDLRILDPACGSGSFLIGAYQLLLDWHRDWYMQDGAERHTERLYQAGENNWRLTTAEKKRILLNNIYGVDIDPQAVEVTKLSLLLKVLEGETQESIGTQMRLWKERALPDLGSNVKCGNSLIGYDFFEGRETSPPAPLSAVAERGRAPAMVDEEIRARINPLDWASEFPEVMGRGGFDAVVGNPPWGADIDDITDYIQQRYPDSTHGYRDSFKLFIEKGVHLACDNGYVSFIIPSAFMFQPRYVDVRRLLRHFSIEQLWNIGDKVFGSKVVAPSCLFVVSKKLPSPETVVNVLDTAALVDTIRRAETSRNPIYRYIPQSIYEQTTEEAFVTYFRELGPNEVPLGDVLECRDCGIKHQRSGVGMEQKGQSDLASRLYYEGAQQSPMDHRFLIGADLNRNGWYMDYSAERYFRDDRSKILRDNESVYFNERIFELPEKIVWRQTSDRVRATIIGSHWFANTLQAGVLKDHRYDLRYVLGLLNSQFVNFIYTETVKETGRVFPQVKLAKVRALPFRTIDFSNPAEVARHDQMVTLVERMLDLHRRVASAKTPHEKESLERQIAATDGEIDRLVYALYGLTEEEIAIVEGRS